ncbi:MAG: hypothetical protein RLZZ360_3 [Candidatus Parcubacteria bacterium]|jgi:hypothetical protein
MFTKIRKLSNKLHLAKSIINGTGLYVSCDFKKGEFIDYIHGPKIKVFDFQGKLAEKSMNWVGASKYTWIITDDSPFRYINHSCEPNVAIRGERTVYALRDIKANEEIVMDYSLTEADPKWYIRCNCKSQACRTHIGPITSLDPATFQRYKKLVTPKFMSVYLNK